MRFRSGLIVVAAVAAAPTAFAQQGAGWETSYTLGATSDYVFRGVSQTDGDPAVQASIEASDGLLYVGAWASNVSFAGDDDTRAEVDLYAGVKPVLFDWTFDVGATAFLYPGQPDGAAYDYVEAKLGASRAFGPVTLGAAAYWSPDFFGADEKATYLVGDASWDAMDTLTLSAQVGRQWVSSDADYTHWSVGATYKLNDMFAVDLRYHDTDEHGFGDIYDQRVVASLTSGF